MAKTIATLFFNLENIHLIKDVGMIPYTMHTKFGYDVILPVWSNREYPYLKKYFSFAKISIIEYSDNEKIRRINTCKWLIANAKKIDVLHLYFFNIWTCYYIKLYKALNHKGLVYVHLDNSGEQHVKYLNKEETLKSKLLKNFILTKKTEKDILWGLQNYKNSIILNGNPPFNNTIFVPNGFYWEKDLPAKPFKERDNTIITVARNGTHEKRTDILMNGFAQIANEFPKWKLVLAGTVEDSFKPFIEDYFNKYPDLKKRVQFIGPIYDRNELQKFYNNSKIFCLPSLWESFGLVTIEALSMGCFMIGSNIEANKDITQNGKYGILFEKGDLNDFVKKLRYCLNHEDEMEKVSTVAYDFVKDYYKWETVLKPVDEWIKNKLGS